MSHRPEERLRFVFRPEISDLELMCADETPRTWRVFNDRFALTLLRTWKGRVDYRRRRVDGGPGEVFCSQPGETHTAVPINEGLGSFKVVQISERAFAAQCQVEGLRAPPHFRLIMANATPRLGGALRAIHAALEREEATSLELQSCLALLARAAVAEVLEPLPRPMTRLPARDSVQRLRELLHSAEGSRVSLLEFARDCGMSQFELLRGFKRLYGLPPHAYELAMRVERARAMLREGYTVAQAASAHDFTDQSHFTRHFRRILGVTPGRYAMSAPLKQLAARCRRSPSRSAAAELAAEVDA
jgi:AraC-like DNA-binding protein